MLADQAQETTKEHPPSWDQVMKEKKIEEIKESSTVEEVPIIENKACTEVLSAKERFYKIMKKTLHYMKLTAQSLATVADFTLMLASLFILYLGCLILTHQLEASRVMYHKTFHNIGQAIVVIGCLNILVFCPFGIWGTWKTNRLLVKTHNYWLVINILVHLVLLMHVYFNFMYQDSDKRKQKCEIEFKKVYRSCTGYPDVYNLPNATQLPECCCVPYDLIYVKPYQAESKITKVCWPFESSQPSNETPDEYWSDCGNKQDYLNRMIGVIKDGYRFFWLFISIEVSTLFFGILSALSVAHTERELEILKLLREGPEEELVETRSKPKRDKKDMSLCKQVLMFFIIKRIFWIFLTFIISISLIAIKGLTDTINVKLPPPAPPGTTVTLWDLIAGFFKLEMY
ncbi:unnamed protein product [Ceutorhynchus assimilis]|uniref:Tetraspanin n=1 Tax=Ceutorhynchus assimilis TaxID=467358 RepID=A0A9P0GT74_9CUCU|nr:unnamed protein product [Ceutorhynchus assimilis]